MLAAVALALRRRRGGTPGVVTLGALAASGSPRRSWSARQAWKGGPPADFTWVTYFTVAHVLAWLALMLLAADVVVELTARRAPPVPADPPDTTPHPPPEQQPGS